MASATEGFRSASQTLQDSAAVGQVLLGLNESQKLAAHLQAATSHMAAALMHQEAARHLERGLKREAQAYGRSARANSERAHSHSCETRQADDIRGG